MTRRIAATLGAVATALLLQVVTENEASADCYRRCYYGPHGRRVCRTVCHRHDPGVAVLSSTSALLLSTSALNNAHHKELYLMQATEDAAHYLGTGQQTGVLPSLIRLSRESAEKEFGPEAEAQLTDEEVVRGILESAEALLSS